MSGKIKTFCVLLFFLFPALTVYGKGGPHIKVLGEPWDFGKVKQGEKKEKVFVLENAGDRDLVLEKVHSCCGYTIVDVSSWEAAPGNNIQVRISLDSSRKNPGKDEKAVTVASNDEQTPELRISVFSYIAGLPESPAVPETRPVPEDVPSVTAANIRNRISEGERVIFLDVREREEFSGKHIPGAINFPRSGYAVTDGFPRDILERMDRDIPVAVYCGGGFRSSYIARKLGEKGYTAYNMEGGLKSWENSGFDIIKGPEIPFSMRPLEINLEEVHDHYYILFKEEVLWIDVRDKEEYGKGHIKGAINIPLYLLKENIDTIPRNKQLVLYCYDPSCEESTAAARILMKNGFKKGMIRVFRGGLSEWKRAGYPVVPGK